MGYTITYTPVEGAHTIKLPASKSESNRVLVLNFLAGNKTRLENLSESNDTRLLQKNLEKIQKGNDGELDCHDAGTTFRFLLSVCCITPGTYKLTGTPRLQERPVAALVEALQQLGADIVYQEKEGFAPLYIKGKKLQGGKVQVNGVLSSQFVSSLLLVAPFLPSGMEIELVGKLPSRPYVEMTLDVLKKFGAQCTWENSIIKVKSGLTPPENFAVENDWSSLSYFLPITLLRGNAQSFAGLKANSAQGDKALVEMLRYFGLREEWREGVLNIYSEKPEWKVNALTACFAHYPDTVPSFLVSMMLFGPAHAKLTGLESLQHKESDRTRVLSLMAEQCGCTFSPSENGSWLFEKGIEKIPALLSVFSDHRMAMSFALLAMKYQQVEIDDVDCVKKSFPSFWEQLARLGFTVTENKS